jgi:hypothetical protein
MSKSAAIILSTITLLVGVAAGGWGAAIFYGHLMTRLCINSLTGEASTTVATLKRLRAGDETNAVELLELKLDGDLIGLGGFLADPHELKSDPLYIKTLQMAKDYRVQFPHKTDSPDIDQSVTKTFALLDAQTNH